MVRLVVFDCDGTLVDSQHLIVEAMGRAFREMGHEPPAPSAVRAVVGLSLGEAVAALLPDAPAPRARRLVGAYRAAFAELRRRGVPGEGLYAGARAALDDLAAEGFVLGVATGKSRRGLVSTLERCGLAGVFSTLKTADDAPSKPHPGMLREAMADTGAEPGTTLMVGDTVFDMAMARGAGVGALGAGWGYHPRRALLEAGAREVVPAFSHIPGAVRRWADREIAGSCAGPS